MNTPWFFLSYANVDSAHDAHVAKFYSDLVEELRVAAHLKSSLVPDSEVGFFDKTGMGSGTVWPEALVNALRECRVLVCLYSGGYFDSVPCGREFTIFNSRIDERVEKDKTEQRPALIIPVLWALPKDFPKSLPPALLSIDYKSEFSDALVKARGLYYVKKTDRDAYKKFVSYLASKINEVAEPPIAPTQTEIPPFEQVESAFHKGMPISQVEPPTAPRNLKATAVSAHRINLAWGGDSGDKSGFYVERCAGADCTDFKRVSPDAAYETTFADDGLKPKTTYNYRVRAFNKGGYSDYSNTATATTLPEKRWHTAALIILCLVIVAGLIYWIRRSNGDDGTTKPSNGNTARHKPALYDQEWSDGFATRVTEGKRGWIGMHEWDLSPEWTVADNGENDDGWLVVKGTEPGVGRGKVFGDFEIKFTVMLEEGTKAGWLLRAEGDKQNGYTGHYFVLEKPPGEYDSLLLLVYKERPRSDLTPTIYSVGITQYKLGDDILVQARAEGNSFYFVFERTNTSPEDTRPGLDTCFPVVVPAAQGLPASGYVGLFAGDGGSRFQVDFFKVTPLTPTTPRTVECTE